MLTKFTAQQKLLRIAQIAQELRELVKGEGLSEPNDASFVVENIIDILEWIEEKKWQWEPIDYMEPIYCEGEEYDLGDCEIGFSVTDGNVILDARPFSDYGPCLSAKLPEEYAVCRRIATKPLSVDCL